MVYRKYLDNFLTRTGPFTDPDAFEPGDAAIAGLERMKIL
jgi:ubiquitin-activating enzyme E1 C